MPTDPAHTPAPGAAAERRWLGHGLALRSTGRDSIGHDLVFAPTADGRDLALVEGGENLAQSLSVALLTAPGTDPFHTRFGFDGLQVLTRGLTQPMALELLRLSVLRTVSVESRVAEVLDLTLTETGPGTRRWQVDVLLRTVLGSVLKTTIGEVAADG
ncbi:hypothetical protein [Streptomyces sp. DASNCL29]|uniref:hypothetical protein n=1 Tax=Streptomyces sp. DASNCL29 TaxID=2583819 RepID=UPI00110FD1C9|nr:hypothetical protein [Streptomyces sp. DASNCL29]TMV00043.1 hypothetical protein FGK60_21840 [Streptomyces sp. DASNCL29]